MKQTFLKRSNSRQADQPDCSGFTGIRTRISQVWIWSWIIAISPLFSKLGFSCNRWGRLLGGSRPQPDQIENSHKAKNQGQGQNFRAPPFQRKKNSSRKNMDYPENAMCFVDFLQCNISYKWILFNNDYLVIIYRMRIIYY